jgi:mRNA-degrading endonuclease YafQ of YafQ-DinJ toxin-antitoxin module
MMQLLQTRLFKKAVSKLHKNQKQELDQAIRVIMDKPCIGTEKIGDLKKVRVYKFSIVNQLMLLAYEYNSIDNVIIFLALGTHENFYRDLKSTNKK